ncbi:MAG: hypothetical protein H5T34_04955 [Candidatus Methanomethyliales bacterium]|nr:hypothetical protein [Candidatus Methanomethylicales archaeon]
MMLFEEIIASFIATLLGVLLGIPSALWIDRKIKLCNERERAIAVLSALKEEINHNVSLLKQIQKELSSSSVIFYNLDLNTWRATSLEDFETIIDHDVICRIFRLYYEYEHLSRKIDVQFHMHYSPTRALQGYLKEREVIVNAILVHAAVLEKESEQLLNKIDEELKRMKDSRRG